MAARRCAKDGICRRQLIRAIVAKARAKGMRVPSHAKIAAVLGVSPAAVTYHFKRMKGDHGRANIN